MTLSWTPQTAMSQQEIDNFLNQKLISRFTSIRPTVIPTPLHCGTYGMARRSGSFWAPGNVRGNTSETFAGIQRFASSSTGTFAQSREACSVLKA